MGIHLASTKVPKMEIDHIARAGCEFRAEADVRTIKVESRQL
jgi:hypothetical protein